MARDFNQETKFIFRSLLTLGLFESSNSPLTKNEILTKIGDTIEAEHRKQVNRIIEHIKTWLPVVDQGLIKTGKRGRENEYSFDFEHLNRKEYVEFLEVLLTLNEIWNRNTDVAINDLYNKEGEGSLGIISKLMVAIKEKKEIRIKHLELDQIIKFIPKSIIKQNNKWYIDGSIQNAAEIQPPLEISRIDKIESIF